MFLQTKLLKLLTQSIITKQHTSNLGSIYWISSTYLKSLLSETYKLKYVLVSSPIKLSYYSSFP